MKKGKYGDFLECGDLRKSLNSVKINVPIKEIKIEDALTILSERINEGNSLVRKISNDLAIRKGKYGDYIFYKTETMKKPQFLKLNDFNDDYTNCSLEFLNSWIKEKYGEQEIKYPFSYLKKKYEDEFFKFYDFLEN